MSQQEGSVSAAPRDALPGSCQEVFAEVLDSARKSRALFRVRMLFSLTLSNQFVVNLLLLLDQEQ